MKTKTHKIYRLICFVTNLSYIGQTCKSVEKRIYEHIGNDSYIGNAIRKYELKNFKIEILWVATSKETANCIEIAAINFYNSLAPNGYNLTKGGEGGDTFANNPNKKEVQEKMRESSMGNQNALGNQNVKGKHWKWPEESKVKIQGKSNAKGKHWNLSIETIEKMSQAKLGNQYAKKKVL